MWCEKVGQNTKKKKILKLKQKLFLRLYSVQKMLANTLCPWNKRKMSNYFNKNLFGGPSQLFKKIHMWSMMLIRCGNEFKCKFNCRESCSERKKMKKKKIANLKCKLCNFATDLSYNLSTQFWSLFSYESLALKL